MALDKTSVGPAADYPPRNPSSISDPKQKKEAERRMKSYKEASNPNRLAQLGARPHMQSDQDARLMAAQQRKDASGPPLTGPPAISRACLTSHPKWEEIDNP